VNAPCLGEDWRNELSSLSSDWDGDNASQITTAAIVAVARFSIVPCHNGGIQLEVHQDGYDIEIDIGPDGKIKGLLVVHGEAA
jgi:hypothetical protein